ncbi:MAG: type II/IV secretion system ATPase subunit, partial [Nanoarchaeota archaeon]|nr:type II/IV secretion system ATPase subunit [Nanoarchaeota archaeon]
NKPEEKKVEKVKKIEFLQTITKKVLGVSLEKYPLNIDKAKVEISVEKTEEGLIYAVSIPEINIGTKALLDSIRKDLINIATIGVGEIVDQKSVTRIKNKFMIDSVNLLQKKVPGIKIETADFLVGILMQEMLGLGKIEFLINDPALEEIVIVNSKEIRVFHKKYGWVKTNLELKSEDEVTNYANIIARRVGRQISVLNPLLDAHVVTGDRANAVLYPISTKGNTITIRKFSRDPWTIIDLIENHTVSDDVAAILWLAIEYEMNVLFSGGTASGKTVFLNACMPFIPPNHRIISMEDTRELMLPRFLYWCPLVTRSPNPEGKGEVSMLDLLVNSLRMRPDRIVLGEIRRQREAEVLFEAMHTGHSVYSTVHADTANETIRRLTNPPINVPPSMLNSVNLNVVMFRDRRKGFRRVLQLAEFMPGKETLTANLLFRWVPEKDEFVKHNKSYSFFDQLSRNTGMDDIEIEKNIENKKKIFDWLIKNKIRNLESIGKVMNLYYTDNEKLKEIIRTNQVSKIADKKQVKRF